MQISQLGLYLVLLQQLLYKQPGKVGSAGLVCILVPQDILVTSSSC